MHYLGLHMFSTRYSEFVFPRRCLSCTPRTRNAIKTKHYAGITPWSLNPNKVHAEAGEERQIVCNVRHAYIRPEPTPSSLVFYVRCSFHVVVVRNVNRRVPMRKRLCIFELHEKKGGRKARQTQIKNPARLQRME